MAESLTNEELAGICSSSFELAHYAIRLGRHFIKCGREAHPRDILKEIKKHPSPTYMEQLEVDMPIPVAEEFRS